jgi:hypothetical protein
MTTIERRKAQVPPQYKTLYEKVTVGKAAPKTCIKAMCLECMGWQRAEVAKCTATACPLYKHRPYKV